jgi:ABC-type multidrug transport system fused ATPase/permease subunit
LELALVTGGVALAAVLFASQSAVVAVGTLTLFLAAGSRVMPSILRFQVAVIGIRNAAGMAEVTFTLAEDMVGVGPDAREDPLPSLSTVHPGFAGEVLVQGVSYAYPGASTCALVEVTFQVPEGQSVAIVGPSGAGKSTLADVLLGLLDPDSGRISISGLDVNDALSQWPGAVTYVPQTVFIAQATLRQNVALGLPGGAVNDSQIVDALARAQLDDFVTMLPQGLDEPMGENGFRLSGGQRQRIGIARALLSHPKLILLDEATSALDAETEAAIGETLRSLRGNVTAIVIAHRLSTVKDCDQVIYMDKGRVLAKGTFAEVVVAVPALGRQASLMGLGDEFPSVGG